MLKSIKRSIRWYLGRARQQRTPRLVAMRNHGLQAVQTLSLLLMVRQSVGAWASAHGLRVVSNLRNDGFVSFSKTTTVVGATKSLGGPEIRIRFEVDEENSLTRVTVVDGFNEKHSHFGAEVPTLQQPGGPAYSSDNMAKRTPSRGVQST